MSVAIVAPGATMARSPVVVELFTAQGCSSCGLANSFVDKLADLPNVVTLTWPVDYWDYLGWKDTFARPEFTDRQRAYDSHFGLNDVYTPQVIVDGRAQASGDKTAAVQTLVDHALRTRIDAPQIRARDDGRIGVGSGRRPRGGAQVWLVRFDPREQTVEVTAGDNRGKAVAQRNVVRQVVLLGSWKGRPVVFRPPPTPDDRLQTLILIQLAHGGAILGAKRLGVGAP